MYSPTPPPPVPPPKPSSHDASRLGTPAAANSPRPPPPPPMPDDSFLRSLDGRGKETIPDPGDQWLPKILEDKSPRRNPLRPSNPRRPHPRPSTIHPSLAQTRDALLSALDENVGLAAHLTDLEARLAQQRAAAQAQLLSTHALERQWRAKQAEMDAALAPFSPGALYARLGQSLAEQEAVCRAMEESFLEGGGEAGVGVGGRERSRRRGRLRIGLDGTVMRRSCSIYGMRGGRGGMSIALGGGGEFNGVWRRWGYGGDEDSNVNIPRCRLFDSDSCDTSLDRSVFPTLKSTSHVDPNYCRQQYRPNTSTSELGNSDVVSSHDETTPLLPLLLYVPTSLAVYISGLAREFLLDTIHILVWITTKYEP
ncbi:hypothetical protein K449DRAFT_469528 [Hypoxylon sp. EC38]|nr:hypothetical protein K449DRAFT_469528 [Hypoxylon sp. EC38]